MNRRTALFLIGFAILPALLFSQANTTAVLSGTITDASGAVVPGAKMTITSQETGFSRTINSDDQGTYHFVLVPPGAYEVRVEKEGFVTQTQKAVELTVGESSVVDFRLAIGASTQIVEVTGDAATIEAERAQQANLINKQAVENLPINRRDYLTFALLAPGVNDSTALADANTFRVKQTPDSGLSFYGSNGRGNSVNVDGGESNDEGGGVRPTVSQETVQEFQINRSNYSAENNSSRGGVINIVTKSGSNNVHGSLFGFFRHEVLDATNPFAIALQGNSVVRVKPPSNRQQFGGTFGGPIKKDKTFYFVGYEQLRRRESATVPVLTDLSIFQPTPAQQAFLATLPAATGAALTAALTSPQSTIDMFRQNSGIFPFVSNDYMGLVRIDHQINDRNQLSFRFNVTSAFETNQNLTALVGFSRGYVQEALDTTAHASWTHIFSSNVINEARAQFDYYNPYTGTNDPFGPALEIAGYGAFNRDRFLPSATITRHEELADNLNFSKGTHQFKIGTYNLIRMNRSNSQTFFSGRFTFGTLPAAFVNPVFANTPITINALQAFNLGLAQSYQQGFGDPVVKATHPLYAGFAQDTWRALPNLTLNYGVRYEVDTRKPPLPTNKKDFAPRFGFAGDPFHDKKTIIRGGYGLFYAAIDYQIDYVVNALNEINGFRQIAQVLTTLSPTNPLAVTGPVNIFSTLRKQGIIGVPTPTRPILASDLAQFGIVVSQTGPRPPLTVLFHNSADYQNPLAQQASFGIEREIAHGFTGSISYIFVRGEHLTTSRDQNLLPAPVNPAKGIRDWGATADNPTGFKYFVNPLLFQDNVYESGANSFYHGMILEFSKRFSRNLTFNGNYTFSKAIDETTDYNSDFQPNDQLCRRCERSLSSFDQRHKVVVYAVMQSPHADAGSSGWRKFFGDFGFSPIYRYNSPRPFNILAGGEVNNDRHNTTDRPIFAGRNIGIGPNFWSFDSRLSRRIRLTENSSVDLIAEAFNLFNHLNYQSVNNTVGCSGTAAAGSPNSCFVGDVVQRYGGLSGQGRYGPSQPFGFTSAFDPRRIQLGVRFAF